MLLALDSVNIRSLIMHVDSISFASILEECSYVSWAIIVGKIPEYLSPPEFNMHV